ncbi:MAG: hypothetical protein HY619_06225 [Thaumarchaeota archaeon]|nr:hypothetical protein [Nitrososphaerota archaeon]
MMAGRGMIIATLLVTVVSSLTWMTFSQELRPVTIELSKSVPMVTTQGEVLTVLTIKNNSTSTVFGLEIQESFNSAFTLEGNVTVRFKDQIQVYEIATPSVNQYVLPLVFRVEPSETIVLEYWSKTTSSGDFRVPASLVFFMYQTEFGSARSSLYSNALLVHVPTALERAATEMIPYFVAVASIVITSMSIYNLRKTLKP